MSYFSYLWSVLLAIMILITIIRHFQYTFIYDGYAFNSMLSLLLLCFSKELDYYCQKSRLEFVVYLSREDVQEFTYEICRFR